MIPGRRRGARARTLPRAIGRGRLVTAGALACALASGGCGDPIVVLGDLPGIMRVVLGVAPDGSGESGPQATRTPLTGPRAAVATPDGVLYVADVPAQAILAVAPSGDVRTVVDHAGCGGASCLSRPEALALDGNGDLLVADPGAGRVWRIDVQDGSVDPVAGLPGAEPARPGADALQVSLDEPSGVAAAPDGAVYFSERVGHRIWRVEQGGTLTPVAGTGEAGHRDGEAALARFRTPAGLALSGETLWVADQGNHRVRAVDLVGQTVSSPVGTGTAAFAGDGGSARSASLRNPEGVAISSDGSALFIADKGNNRVRRVTLASGIIVTFVGTGTDGFNGTGLEAGATDLASPSGVALFGAGFLFVADTGNRLVWRTPLGG